MFRHPMQMQQLMIGKDVKLTPVSLSITVQEQLLTHGILEMVIYLRQLLLHTIIYCQVYSIQV